MSYADSRMNDILSKVNDPEKNVTKVDASFLLDELRELRQFHADMRERAQRAERAVSELQSQLNVAATPTAQAKLGVLIQFVQVAALFRDKVPDVLQGPLGQALLALK